MWYYKHKDVASACLKGMAVMPPGKVGKRDSQSPQEHDLVGSDKYI